MSSSSETGAPPDRGLWEAFLAGDRAACSRLITLFENRPERAAELRDRLLERQRGAVRVGITGPPGVGKSTVTAGLARRAAAAGHEVGVLAVDPSSPFTGGAFLGDRVRMQGLVGDRVFIRSMASREGHGGLSPATARAAEVLDAFGMDRILIETVGVGQAELDVLSCSDLVVLVLQPGTGDVIQALKAGVIEAADLLLVNKSDLPGTEALLQSLRFLYRIGGRSREDAPPIVTASALQETGMDEAYAAIERGIAERAASGRLREKKRQRIEGELREALERELWGRFAALTNAPEEIKAAAGELLESGRPQAPVVRALAGRIRMEIAHEGT